MQNAEGKRQKGESLVRLAQLLGYPLSPPVSRSDDSPAVLEFFEEIARVAPEGLEELYTRTFDLNPVATLEIGWHLWGEQYERGRFLAELRGLEDALGVECATELPDHLTALLPTIARMEFPDPLIEKIEPALAKIAKPLEEQGNPYRHLIAGVVAALDLRTAAVPAAGPEASSPPPPWVAARDAATPAGEDAGAPGGSSC